MRLEYLETPALVVDLDALEYNIEAGNRMLEGSKMKNAAPLQIPQMPGYRTHADQRGRKGNHLL